MDDRYLVETPEIVAVAYNVAGIGSRCLAAVVDTLLIITLQVALGAAIMAGSAALNADEAGIGSLLFAVWALISFVILWGYYLLFELLWNGQSPGKRMFGLRVVREGGRPITLVASALRNLIRVIDFLPLLYGLGALVMFADRRSRRLGDFAAGSLVVREGTAISLESLTQSATPVVVPPRLPDAPPTPLLPNLHLISPEQYDLAQDFLRRRAELEATRRTNLATRLAHSLRNQIGLTSDGSPELFLEHFVREYRLHQELREQEGVRG